MGAGSDDGSNSTPDLPQGSHKSEPAGKGSGHGQGAIHPQLLGLGAALGSTCMAGLPAQWPVQGEHRAQHEADFLQVAACVLPPERSCLCCLAMTVALR